MKKMIFTTLGILMITYNSCQFCTNDKHLSKRELEEQEREERKKIYQEQKNKAIQQAEVYNSKLQIRPKLKDFILDSKRPDIYNSRGYKVTSTSVANLPGQIDIEFDRNTCIKIIKFKHEVLLKDKVLELNEFANLVAENYNFQWHPSMDKENPSYAEYNFIRDSTSFFLSGEGKEVHYVAEMYSGRIKELQEMIKNLWKDGLQGWEVQKMQDYEREIYRYSHSILITYIFEISNQNYIKRMQKEHSIKEYGEELKRIEYINQKELKKKTSQLNDF